MNSLISLLKSGYADLNNRNYSTAIECADKAFKIDPTNKDALALKAMASYHLLRFEDAEKILKGLCQKRNVNTALIGFYLDSLYRQDKFQQCIQAYKDLNQSLLNESLTLIVIKCMQSNGDYSQAIELAHNKITDGVKKLEILCWTHEILNQDDEALKHAQSLLKIQPENFLALTSLVKIHLKNKELNSAKELINRINHDELNPNNQAILLNLKAKIEEKTGHFDKAFQLYSYSNECLKSTQSYKNLKYNSYYTLHRIEEIQQKLSHFLKVEAKGNIETPVFMVGFPRSGTTLLESILSSHSQIKTIEEKPMIHNLLVKGFEDIGLENVSLINVSQRSELQRLYLDEVQKYKEFKEQVIIDKLPLNLMHMGLIYQIFPNAKFIVSHRDHRDVSLSCFFQTFALNDAMSYFLNWNKTNEYLSKFIRLGRQTLQSLPVIHKWVEYEKLIQDPFLEVKKVIGFLNLNWEEELYDYRDKLKNKNINTPSYSEVRKEIHQGNKNRWKNYTLQIEEVKHYWTDVN